MNAALGAEVHEIDEIDRALINTLQIDPRAAWTRVGHAIGIDPVTAARRWERLVDAGAAWITAQPSGVGCAAFVEVDCAGSTQEIAAALSRWPQVLSIEFTSGSRDLLLTVGTPDLSSLSRLIVGEMGSLPGMASTRTHLVTHVHAYGGDWRIRALDSEQQARLPARRGRDARPTRVHTPAERTMLMVLSRDGRASYVELAAEMGCSINTARRRLHTMMADGLITLRCDIAQPLSGWPVTLWLWAQVPQDRADRIARGLSSLPEARACVALTGGSSNFLYCAWLHSLEDAQRLEQQLVAAVPGLVVVDRGVVLGFAKRMGQLVNGRGHRTGCVPMDLWSVPEDSP